ncbi:MAG: CoA transferase [Acidimicrobiia bacterium]|nr:CoA transferase [Acidimicrobiia bacterium]MXZ86710.1 CoA transferase [Acidimicrobiia bacterium]MYE74486.1 CoA transferase [Acidimicrobiia bacterium]MYG71206.1 CoA transferase [Acidimicrobiia bacterium]MYJ61994.1 CoA transferase [Acidimicrobiia bacterium]
MSGWAANSNAAQPLAGIRVLDFSQIMMGPVATQLLADHGADVLKIERPGSGDIFRHAIVDPDGAEHPAFGAVNRNKRSVAVDVRAPEGLALIDDLVAKADVVVNNYRPGVMDRLGLGYERLSEINPGIVYAQGTGFGTEGVYAHKGGQDILAQALTGAMAHKAEDDHPTAIYPVSLADYTAGMHMVQGILMALLQRSRTGRGQRVQVSLYDSLLAMQILEATMSLMGREVVNWARLPLVGTFSSADGEVVVVGAFKANPLRDICAALEMPDLSTRPEFATMAEQAVNRPRLQALIAEAIGRFSTAEVIERLEAQDVLCAPVRTLDEALDDPHTAPMIAEMPRPALTPLRSLASPVHLPDTPASVRFPPPRLGQGAGEALADYGIESERVDALLEAGVLA